MYDIVAVNDLLKNTDTYETLVKYCQTLSNQYSQTNEGRYRIKYNDLYPILFSNLSDEKLVKYFNSFATSLDIYPIIEININGISLRSI